MFNQGIPTADVIFVKKDVDETDFIGHHGYKNTGKENLNFDY